MAKVDPTRAGKVILDALDMGVDIYNYCKEMDEKDRKRHDEKIEKIKKMFMDELGIDLDTIKDDNVLREMLKAKVELDINREKIKAMKDMVYKTEEEETKRHHKKENCKTIRTAIISSVIAGIAAVGGYVVSRR